ncbi:MAG: DUF2778 domain-containing protein [Methylovirgula sp.]
MTYGVGTPRDFIPYECTRLSWKTVYQCTLGAATLSLGVLVGGLFLYGRPGFELGAGKAPEITSSSVKTAAKASPRASGFALVTALRLHRSDVANNEDKAVKVASAPANKPSGFAALIMPLREASHLTAANVYGGLLDPTLAGGNAPQSFAESHPLGAVFAALPPQTTNQLAPEVAELETAVPVPEPRPEIAQTETPEDVASVPMPMPRPAELASVSHEPERAGLRHFAQEKEKQQTVAEATPPAAATQPDKPSFFDKLFGSPQEKPVGATLAYASAEDNGGIGGIFGNRKAVATAPIGGFDRYTAVYNIAAHTVYLPDGTRLEAHSGLGEMMDNPHYVKERMRGATPPAVYELQPREQLFHGVQALRLNPVGGEVFGRTGLLAHTYMLGPNGQSNGCVSFRDYAAFLRAYENGQIKRLAVVAGL